MQMNRGEKTDGWLWGEGGEDAGWRHYLKCGDEKGRKHMPELPKL